MTGVYIDIKSIQIVDGGKCSRMQLSLCTGRFCMGETRIEPARWSREYGLIAVREAELRRRGSLHGVPNLEIFPKFALCYGWSDVMMTRHVVYACAMNVSVLRRNSFWRGASRPKRAIFVRFVEDGG